VETTGFSKRDRIIEIGAVELIDGVRTGVLFQSYLKVNVPVHPAALEVHHISKEEINGAVEANVILASFLAWVGKSALVAHNARFDMRFLVQELERMGLKKWIEGRRVFCTMKEFRKRHEREGYALNDLALFYHISLKNFEAHSALEDAEMVASVFVKMVKEKKEKEFEI